MRRALYIQGEDIDELAEKAQELGNFPSKKEAVKTALLKLVAEKENEKSLYEHVAEIQALAKKWAGRRRLKPMTPKEQGDYLTKLTGGW